MSTTETDVYLRFQRLPGSNWLTQDPAMLSSDICIRGRAEVFHPGRVLTIVGARGLSGALPHQVIDPETIRVAPQLQMGDIVIVHCTFEDAPREPSSFLRATRPSPDLGYGLQRSENEPQRHPQ